MKNKEPILILASSPFLKQNEDTAFIMRQVIYALLPVVAAAFYFFGISAILVTLSCIAGVAISEWFINVRLKKGGNTLRDGSGIITGILLALTLPPGIPLWMAFLGGVFAIVIGKLIFGGIGYNIFNPALVGRAFLQASFPVSLTTWSPMIGEKGTHGFFTPLGANLTLPFLKSDVHAVTSATPLASWKFTANPVLPGTDHLFLGTTSGSLGETSALIILAAGLYLAIRGIVNWRIPLSIFATVLAIAGGFYLAGRFGLAAPKHPLPWFHLLTGGLMLGAVFMATDMVTCPITQTGCVIFGIGVGILVMVIRLFGGLPEGVMYSILLMNAVTPLINKYQPRVFGTASERQKAII